MPGAHAHGLRWMRLEVDLVWRPCWGVPFLYDGRNTFKKNVKKKNTGSIPINLAVTGLDESRGGGWSSECKCVH